MLQKSLLTSSSRAASFTSVRLEWGEVLPAGLEHEPTMAYTKPIEASEHHDQDRQRSESVSSVFTVVDLESQETGADAGLSLKAHAEESKKLVKTELKDDTPECSPKITTVISLATWFTPYRQLFSVVVLLNLVGAVVELSKRWRWATDNLTPLVVGNTLIAIGIRNEFVTRFLYWSSIKLFRYSFFPIWFRVKIVGVLYHIGGLHSGCGMAALIWLVVAVHHHFLLSNFYHVSVLVSLGFCLLCVSSTCLFAFPAFRGPHHKYVFPLRPAHGCPLSFRLPEAVTGRKDFKCKKLSGDVACNLTVPLSWFIGLWAGESPAFRIFRMINYKAGLSLKIVPLLTFGRAGVLSTFAFVLLAAGWDVEKQQWDLSSSRLGTKVELWFLVAIFVLIIASWITVAKVPVSVFTSSERVSVIRVPGGLTSGLHTRISKGGLREWHIFGSISEGKDAKYHYIVAAVQGEFTSMLNSEKPEELYTKRWKPCGLPYFSRMFRRGVAICTGSGIGAVGSTCIQHDDWFLVWIGPSLKETYGPEIMRLISDRIPPERRLIWDTRGPLGRPDVVRLLRDTFQSWRAEVVLFIGSPAINKNVLESSRGLKIPVFGSIWDA